MTYDRFDDHITQKYSVVVKNWPLKDFCNPSSVGSRIELETLYNGWQSGVTRFEKLTEEETIAWGNERFASRLAMMSVAPPQPTPEPASPPHALLPTPLAPPTPINPSLPQPLTTGQYAAQVPSVSRALNPASAESPPLQQTLDPESIATMIRSDPSLQNIDPILLAAGAPQERRFSMVVTAPASTSTPPANPPPPSSRLKRNQNAFQVFTPQSYGIPAKRLRKERGGRHSKKSPTAHTPDNIAPGNIAP